MKKKDARATMRKHIREAKAKIRRVANGEPKPIAASVLKKEKSLSLAPRRGKRHIVDREAVREARVSGMSRERASANFKVPLATIRSWENRYKWATPEAIAIEAHRVKLEMAGIKPAIRKERKVVNMHESAILNANRVQQSLDVIKEKALTLIQIGETNAQRVAESVSALIKTSLEARSVRPPQDMTELSTAFKMVEQATGRNKPQAVQVNLGVSVSPHMSGIIGDLRPGTVTLDAEEITEDVSPVWLSGQLTDEKDLGL